MAEYRPMVKTPYSGSRQQRPLVSDDRRWNSDVERRQQIGPVQAQPGPLEMPSQGAQGVGLGGMGSFLPVLKPHMQGTNIALGFPSGIHQQQREFWADKGGIPAQAATGVTGRPIGMQTDPTSSAGVSGRRFIGGGYMQDPNAGQSPLQNEQAILQQHRDQNRIAGSGPYDQPGALGRFQSLESQPQSTPDRRRQLGPQGGEVTGTGTAYFIDEDGRRHGVGPRIANRAFDNTPLIGGPRQLSPETVNDNLRNFVEHEQGRSINEPGLTTQQRADRIAFQSSSPYVDNASPQERANRANPDIMEQRRQDAITRGRERRESYKAGREARARQMYGLDKGDKTEAPAKAERTYEDRRKDSLADKQRSLAISSQTTAVSSAVDATGMQADKASLDQIQNGYFKSRSKWSDKDVQDYKRYIEDRAINDPDGFGKSWEDFKAQKEFVVEGSPFGGTSEKRARESHREYLENLNRFRKDMGLDPVVFKYKVGEVPIGAY